MFSIVASIFSFEESVLAVGFPKKMIAIRYTERNIKKMTSYQSWGRYPKSQPKGVIPLFWRDDLPKNLQQDAPMLPYGLGRSYGDSCLNNGGYLLTTRALNQFIRFDRQTGILRAESGVSLPEIYRLIVPQGWFLPVVPGTRLVTLGGAIANDIHGKNHHRAGTFGCHIRKFALLRSDGETVVCSPRKNIGLYRATIGGLGLTGLIVWAEIQLKPIASPFINQVTIKFKNIHDFFELNQQLNHDYEYTVAWVDCISQGKQMGRGHFIIGNSAPAPIIEHSPRRPAEHLFTAPCNAPGFALNPLSVRMFNFAYYQRQLAREVHRTVHFEPFFHPLDSIGCWNRIYGKRGFFQYQFVLPTEHDYTPIVEVFKKITRSGMGSFLAVMKTFGDVPSPGMLSFPKPGFTLALDFPNQGQRTHRLFAELDQIVREHGGRIYPAKDARMSPDDFQTFYPELNKFQKYIDPNFSSDFWKRVTH